MPSCCVYILLLFHSNYFHSFLKLALLRQFTILIDSEILIPMVIWLLFVAFPVSKTIQLLSRERERSLVWMCFHWIYLCVLCRYLRLEIISHKSFGFFFSVYYGMMVHIAFGNGTSNTIPTVSIFNLATDLQCRSKFSFCFVLLLLLLLNWTKFFGQASKKIPLNQSIHFQNQ